VFDRFDLNKDGKVNLQEFELAFRGPYTDFWSSEAGATPQRVHARESCHYEGRVDVKPSCLRQQKDRSDDIIRRLAASMVRAGFSSRDLFAQIDADRSNTLSRAELQDVLYRFAPDLSSSECARIFDRFDRDRSGSVTVSEFVDALEKTCPGSVVTIEARLNVIGAKLKRMGYTTQSIWSVFDRNGDGYLSEDEWLRAMRTLVPELCQDEATSIFRHFDQSGDSRLSINEFQTFFDDVSGRMAPMATSQGCRHALPPRYEMPQEELCQREILDVVRGALGNGRAGLAIRDVFRRLDLDGSCTMGRAEFDRMILEFRPGLSYVELGALFNVVNISGSGAITQGEFIRRFD